MIHTFSLVSLGSGRAHPIPLLSGLRIDYDMGVGLRDHGVGFSMAVLDQRCGVDFSLPLWTHRPAADRAARKLQVSPGDVGPAWGRTEVERGTGAPVATANSQAPGDGEQKCSKRAGHMGQQPLSCEPQPSGKMGVSECQTLPLTNQMRRRSH